MGATKKRVPDKKMEGVLHSPNGDWRLLFGNTRTGLPRVQKGAKGVNLISCTEEGENGRPADFSLPLTRNIFIFFQLKSSFECHQGRGGHNLCEFFSFYYFDIKKYTK